VRFPRPLARRIVLWLALAAAFLPTVIPGLHAGHGMPMFVAPQATVATQHTQHAAHGHLHHHATNRSEPSGIPAPASKQPDGGACPICRTLQQLAAWTVPDSAVVVAPVAIVVDRLVAATDVPAVAYPRTPSQPRAPPAAV
jgi:hypothetical protein